MSTQMIHDGYVGRGSRTYQIYETAGVRWTAFVNGDHGSVRIYFGDLREHFEVGRPETGILALPDPLLEFDFDEWESEPCFDCEYQGDLLIAHDPDCYWKANPDADTPDTAQAKAEQVVLDFARGKN